MIAMNINDNAKHFRDVIMDHFYIYSCVLHTDNYDSHRFGPYKKNPIEKYDHRFHREYLYFFLENFDGLFQTFNLLSDQYSRDLFIELILYRLLGFPHVKLSTNTETHWRVRKSVNQYIIRDSELAFENWQQTKLKHFEFNYNGSRLSYDGLPSNLAWTFFMPMYEYAKGNIFIGPEIGDCIYDCGGCFGDTALKFASQAGNQGMVESFDFLPNHITMMDYNRIQNTPLAEIIKVRPYAVGEESKNIDCHFLIPDTKILPGASLLSDEFKSQPIPTVAIDDWLSNGKIKTPDMIKMDIEGYELAALKGAANTIRQTKPKLAISLYHQFEDFVTIPAFIKKCVPEYHFFIDHYTIHHEETVLYAQVFQGDDI
jgi:FkbM family methyltransferase